MCGFLPTLFWNKNFYICHHLQHPCGKSCRCTGCDNRITLPLIVKQNTLEGHRHKVGQWLFHCWKLFVVFSHHGTEYVVKYSSATNFFDQKHIFTFLSFPHTDISPVVETLSRVIKDLHILTVSILWVATIISTTLIYILINFTIHTCIAISYFTE